MTEISNSLKDQGNDYFKKGDYAVAITLYSQAIDELNKSGKENAIYYGNRANAHFQLGDFVEARTDAEKAIGIDENYMKGYWRLAEISKCTSKHEDALKYYKQAHDINPNSRQVAEQYLNMSKFLNKVREQPKTNFFAALANIPCRTFVQPSTGQQGQQQQYPGMNQMFSNPFGSTGTAPDTVSEEGRDFLLSDSLITELTTNEMKVTFLEKLFDYCCNIKYLHSNQLLKLITQIGQQLEPVKAVYKMIVEHADTKTIIVGDLHGSIIDFKILFGKIHPISKIVNSNDNIIILGDYVDRGEHGHQIICFLAALKLLCPERVHLLRGNHETCQMNNFFGYQSQVERAYGSKSQMFDLMQQLFKTLPLLLFIEDTISNKNYACFHGGVPLDAPATSIDDFISRNIEKAMDPTDPLSQQLLWSDPDHLPNGTEKKPSHRGVGYIYGKGPFDEFKQKLNLSKVFRGHEVVFEKGGVRDDFSDQSHYTVFSSSNYMGQGNIGGVAVLYAGKDTVDFEPLLLTQ